MSFLMGLLSSSVFSAAIHLTACLTLSPSGMIVAMISLSLLRYSLYHRISTFYRFEIYSFQSRPKYPLKTFTKRIAPFTGMIYEVPMDKKLLPFLLLVFMLLGLPILGAALSGNPLSPYFEFPPHRVFVRPKPFSWWAFSAYALFAALCILPFLVQGLRKPTVSPASPDHPGSFPWWGLLGGFMGVCAWVLAWTRFPWFQSIQAHTFTPLWLAYILLTNAFAFRRSGRCLMLDQPRRFLLLFPASAALWWFFEYLNRFVQNWQYAGVELEPWEYFLYATLSFSTVLPAVMSTRQWFLTFPRIQSNFSTFFPVRLPNPRIWGGVILCLSAVGLACLAIQPNHTYALVWVSPLLIVVSTQALAREPSIFSPVARGDWRGVLSCALAALMCGFFWEMWNYLSLARWTYAVPFVQRFHVFEMPILGYVGYLPFGVTCGAFSEMVLGKMKSAQADFI
jgi:hypothetical protein